MEMKSLSFIDFMEMKSLSFIDFVEMKSLSFVFNGIFFGLV